jgi:hypothetical protein
MITDIEQTKINLARSGFRMMRRRRDQDQYWLIFSQPLTRAQIEDFIQGKATTETSPIGVSSSKLPRVTTVGMAEPRTEQAKSSRTEWDIRRLANQLGYYVRRADTRRSGERWSLRRVGEREALYFPNLAALGEFLTREVLPNFGRK